MNTLDKMLAECVPSHEPGLLFHPPSGLYVRDRGDIGMVADQHKCYRIMKGFTYPPGALMLDLGGHIGDSVWYFKRHPRLVDKVLSIEPDPGNIAVFQANWGNDLDVELFAGAAVGHDTDTVTLYLGRTYTGDNGLEPFRGRRTVEVPAIHYQKLFARNPALIKCDIEGAEFLFDWTMVPDSVTEIVAELHQNRDKWIDAARKIDADILGLGFRHVRAPRHQPFFNKTQIALWSRR